MIKDITIKRFIMIIMVFIIISILMVLIYGGSFKDFITRNTCPLRGEEYKPGVKSGKGECIIPAGMFD